MGIVTVRNLEIGRGVPKVCIPVTGQDDEQILEQTGMALAADADLVEWRVDAYAHVHSLSYVCELLGRLRELLSSTPLLFTLRTDEEGGSAKVGTDEYIEINRAAILSGCVDLIDVEISRDAQAVGCILKQAHASGVRVIASFHDFEKTPESEAMRGKLLKMQESEADIVKLAVMPQSIEDVCRLLEVTATAKADGIHKPLITMSMGRLGSLSRVCGEYVGSAVTFAAAGAVSAPGQMPAGDVHQVLDIFHRSLTGTAAETVEVRDAAAKNRPEDIVPEDIRLEETGLEETGKGKLIFLIGFMGTGKSSIALKIHELTGMRLIEMDDEIVRREGRSISEIFDSCGEEYFRDLETELLRDLCAHRDQPMVISCGGGAVLRPENVALMRKAGCTILLTASPRTIYQRIGASENRPNLKNRKSVEGIRELMEIREPSYLAAADLVIQTDRKSLTQISREALLAAGVID